MKKRRDEKRKKKRRSIVPCVLPDYPPTQKELHRVFNGKYCKKHNQHYAEFMQHCPICMGEYLATLPNPHTRFMRTGITLREEYSASIIDKPRRKRRRA
jgi:hypothetical protein